MLSSEGRLFGFYRGLVTALLMMSVALWSSMVSSLAPSAAAQSVDAAGQAEASGSLPKARPEFRSEVAWEYSPYQVVVWLVDDGSQLLRQVEQRIKKRIQRDAELDEYNGWQVRCEQPTVVWNSRLGAAWDDKLPDLTKQLADDIAVRSADKLIVIRLGQSRGGFTVQSRELDLATKQWGSLTDFPVAELDLIPARAFSAMRRSFMPLTRIERVASETVYVRTRASALSRRLEPDNAGHLNEVADRNSPLWVRDTDVLVPVLRRDASASRSSNVEPITWTYLSIEERLGSTIKCQTHTAHMAPLAGRSASSIKKFALVVRPEPKPTTLFITSQESKTAAPISGLEVYYCRPEDILKKGDPKKDEPNKDYRLLGTTDWKGAISVAPADDGSIRYIIVRNGKLATKKPILPGLVPTLTAAVPSDKARVFAEGVVFGLRGEIIDFFALRETTRVRIQIALEKKQFEKANKILNEEYLKLISTRDLAIRMSEIKERLMNRKDADIKQRSRIEMMFDDLDKAIKTISDKLPDRDGSDLTNRVLNKNSDPPDKPPSDLPSENPEGATPPNQPQPAAPTTPAPESPEFD